MKQICPNLKNEQVKKEFDELVRNVGENAAYVAWSENNGNSIDQAPNGEPSLLFQRLLNQFKGDRDAAIKAKVKTFANSFKTRFVNTQMDVNGEPNVLYNTTGDYFYTDRSYAKQDVLNVSDTINSEAYDLLKKASNSQEAIRLLLDNSFVPKDIIPLAQSMLKYTVPLSFKTKQDRADMDVALYDSLAGITILPRAFLYSNESVASTILHEMIHFYTLAAYTNPKDDIQKKFKSDMDDAYNYFRSEHKRSKLYGFTDTEEFISEIGSNQAFRSFLSNDHQSVWTKILNAIKSLFKPLINDSSKVQSTLDAIQSIVNYGNDNGVRLSGERYQYMKVDQQDVSEVDQLQSKIVKGLKQRLNAIQRYTADKGKASTEYAIKKLISEISEADSKVAVVEFVQHMNDSISNAVSFLSQSTDKINSKQLVQLKRDYIGYYKPMLRDVSSLIETTDLLSDIPNYDLFVENVDNLASKLSKIEVRYDKLLKIKARDFLKEYATSSGSPFTNEMLQWLDNPNSDIGWAGYYIGMSSNTDNEVVRIMENIIRNVKNNVDRNTRSVGQSMLPLLQKAKDKHGSNVMEMLQEKNKDGTRTGYLVRDRNYGKFYSDRSQFFDKLGEKYKLEKDDRGIYILPDDDSIRRRYDEDVNKWLDQHAERMFKKEYYDYKNALKRETKDAIDEISDRIASIKSKYTVDGIFYNHRMSIKDQNALKQLHKDKQALASDFNFDGSDKTGIDLQIAKDLQNFKKLIGDSIVYKKQSSRFLETAKKMFKLLSQEEYAAWYNFNTHEEYTDQFWKDLNELEKSAQSDEYNKLVEKRRAIHKLFRKDNSLEIDTDLIDDATAKKLKALDEEIAKNYTSPGKRGDSDGVRFKDIAEIAVSDDYRKAYAEAQAAGKLYFDEWYERNHYEDAKGLVKPLSIWTYLKPAHVKYIQRGIPNAMFSEVDESSRLYNKNFDLSGEYTQPKISLYDNRSQYNVIQNSKELKGLYDAVLDTMRQSTEKIGFMQYTNPYKLPQMTARTFQMVARNSDVLQGLKYAVSDAAGIKDDDRDYVPEYELAPDNTPIKNIPTRYLSMLDDPNMITADVVGSVIEFFNMADNFKEMSQVQDDLEMILNRLSQLEVVGKKGKTPGEMYVFKKAQQLLNMNVYGQKKNRLEWNIGGKTIEASKPLGMLYQYTTKVNLAFNMWAMGTNYVTGQGYTDMESILGRYYDISDIAFAKAELFRNLPQNVQNIGNVNAQNKLLSLMQLNQVTRSNEDTYNRLDNSAALRALNQHFWFNGYTAGDFVVKAQVLGSIYHSYRYHDGKFVNKLEFINQYANGDKKAGTVKFNKLKVTLYDAYDKSGNVLDAYKQAVDTKLKNRITNKINTLAQKIDGNLSDSDRSAIHANAYTQFLIMHRNFMIVGIQDRFKGKQFNYNTGEIEEGMYRSTARFIANEISMHKWRVLRQLLADYNNLQDYEKYNVRKTLLEVTNWMALAMAVSFLMVPLADSGDGEDSWAIQAITYLAMRSAFEFRTLYNPFELQAIINSPSAAFNTLEYMSDMIKLLWIPNHLDGGVWKPSDRGAYKGIPKALKNFIKFTPAKNIIEATDPKPKRSYLQNQLMM